ncbi:MAG: hypothetical protein KAI16_01915 [Candidatus Pacebacteria bacterium]|nr:hypothetical protein [Candidatus Paceibacterota bacterium]
MNENYAVGIDLGSQNIKIILVKFSENTTLPKIISKASYPSSGISFGYITNKKELKKSLNYAINKFQKDNNVNIKEVFLPLDGYGLESESIPIIQTMATGLIQKFDLEKISEKSELILQKKNPNQIIDKNIINYIIDKYEYLDDPQGLNAKKLEANTFFLTCPPNNIQNIEDVTDQLNLIVEAFTAGPITSSQFSLQKIDKKIGCILIDYGAEKTSLLLIEKNKPRNFFVIKYGSKNLTEKISLFEKISFKEAEKIKISKIKTQKINKIIKDELTLLAKEINKILKKWNKDAILPGGAIISGGGSNINFIEEIFKKELKLPIKKPFNHILDHDTDYNIVYSNILIGQKDAIKIKFKTPEILEKSWGTIKKIFSLFKI